MPISWLGRCVYWRLWLTKGFPIKHPDPLPMKGLIYFLSVGRLGPPFTVSTAFILVPSHSEGLDGAGDIHD